MKNSHDRPRTGVVGRRSMAVAMLRSCYLPSRGRERGSRVAQGARHYTPVFGISLLPTTTTGVDMNGKWRQRAMWLAVLVVLLLWPVVGW